MAPDPAVQAAERVVVELWDAIPDLHPREVASAIVEAARPVMEEWARAKVWGEGLSEHRKRIARLEAALREIRDTEVEPDVAFRNGQLMHRIARRALADRDIRDGQALAGEGS